MTDTASREQTSANPGREANGRFAAANPGGPGNPFARKVASLRQALVDAVTPKDITEISYILLLNAKAGDLASVKLLFQYVIGKPTPAVEPDALDLNELRLLQAASLPGDAVQEFVTKLPPATAVPLLRALIPEISKHFADACAASLQPAEQEPPKQSAPPPSQPATEKHNERPPLPNGSNGAGHRDAADEYDSAAPFQDENGRQSPSPNGVNGSFISLGRLLHILPTSARTETA